MKKEEILEASKKENKKRDAYELEVESKGSQYAALGILLLTTLFYIYEIVTGKGSNPALYALIAIYCSIAYGYKAIKLERARKLHTFTSVIWGILTIMLVIEYFTGK